LLKKEIEGFPLAVSFITGKNLRYFKKRFIKEILKSEPFEGNSGGFAIIFFGVYFPFQGI